jgi:polysaccharide biosynthesis transport protein
VAENRLLSLIKKEKLLFWLSILLAMVACLTYCTFFYTKLYETEAKLFLRNVARSSVVSEYGDGSTLKTESGYSNPLFNYVQILESDELAFRVYNRLKERQEQARTTNQQQALVPTANTPAEAQQQSAEKNILNQFEIRSLADWSRIYAKMLDARVIPSTDVIELQLKWPDEAQSPIVANTIISELKSMNIELQRSVFGKQQGYLQEELTRIEKDLASVQEKIRDFRLANHAIDLDTESLQLTTSRVDLEKSLQVLNSEMQYNNRTQELLRLLKMQAPEVAVASTSIGEDPYLVTLNSRLAEAEQKLASLRSRFTDAHPEVRTQLNEVATLKKGILTRQTEVLGGAKLKRGIYNPAQSSLVVDLARAQSERVGLQARINALQGGINNLRNQESGIPAKRTSLEDLLKQEDALKTAYSGMKRALLETEIKGRSVVDNLVVLSAPNQAEWQAKDLAMLILGFLLLGTLLGLSTAWLKDRMQDRWLNEDEIRSATGLPFLGLIPWLRHWPTSDPAMLDRIDRAYSGVAHNLAQYSYRDQVQSIAFLTLATEHVDSPMVMNVAEKLVQADRSVLVIDTDAEMPGRHLKLLNNPTNEAAMKAGRNLTDLVTNINRAARMNQPMSEDAILKAIEDCLISIPIEGAQRPVFYLPAAAQATGSIDITASKGFETLMQSLKTHFEFILVDTPSHAAFDPEVQSVCIHTDGAVILLPYHSSRDLLVRLLDQFNDAGVKVLGLISRSLRD